MGRKVRGPRASLVFSTLTVLFITGGLWPFCAENAARAQEPQVKIEPRITPHSAGAKEEGSAARIRIDSDLVLIPVLVTDQHDRSVSGLGRDAFRLWDEKAEQVISHFSAEDAPVSVGLVFDASRSMANKLPRAKAAVVEFIRTANPQDEFSLVMFNNRAQLVHGLTDRLEEIQNAMVFIQAKGCTALIDGVMLSIAELQHAKNRRKAIVIVSDGGDNNSRYSLRELKKRLRESDLQVFSIGILEPYGSRDMTIEEIAGPSLLNDIAKQTGGRMYEVDDLAALPDVASKIGSALRNQYVLGYVPSGEKRDGKFHRVQVKIAQPKGMPQLRASFRRGYFAPEN
jgi:Ca-activated chloride channel homolog